MVWAKLGADIVKLWSKYGSTYLGGMGRTLALATIATLIGFGASSIGRTRTGYAQNITDTGNWRERINAGRFATERGRILTSGDRLRADMIEQILCFFDVDLKATAERHGADPATLSADVEKLAPLVHAGWVAVDRERITIVRHGAELARLVASAFDAYLGMGGRHSVAV